MKTLALLTVVILTLGGCATAKLTRDQIDCKEKAHIIHIESPMCRDAHVYDHDFVLLRGLEWLMDNSAIRGLDGIDYHYRMCQDLEEHLYRRCMTWKEVSQTKKEQERLQAEIRRLEKALHQEE